MNIYDIIKQIKNSPTGECTIFIDKKSAYNTINRDTLKRILEERKILQKDEIYFLFIIYDNMFYKVNEEKKYFERGL